jgi:hypothetical protein
MQAALHCFPQRPQLRHFSVSMAGAKRLNLEKKPRTDPTGQMVLHHVLPCFHARMNITAQVSTAIASEDADFSHISVE